MTVYGVNMVFSKERMIARVMAEGKADMIDDEVISIMDNLDGQPVSTASWNRRVNDMPVLTCLGKDGKHYDVNEDDCVCV